MSCVEDAPDLANPGCPVEGCLDEEMPRGEMPRRRDAPWRDAPIRGCPPILYCKVVRYEAEEAGGGPVGDSSRTKLRRRASEVRCSRLISEVRSFVQVRGVEVLLDRVREFRRWALV